MASLKKIVHVLQHWYYTLYFAKRQAPLKVDVTHDQWSKQKACVRICWESTNLEYNRLYGSVCSSVNFSLYEPLYQSSILNSLGLEWQCVPQTKILRRNHFKFCISRIFSWDTLWTHTPLLAFNSEASINVTHKRCTRDTQTHETHIWHTHTQHMLTHKMQHTQTTRTHHTLQHTHTQHTHTCVCASCAHYYNLRF